MIYDFNRRHFVFYNDFASHGFFGAPGRGFSPENLSLAPIQKSDHGYTVVFQLFTTIARITLLVFAFICTFICEEF